MSSANGLSLWLDAADISAYSGDGCPSTATVPSNGGLVTCVGDKSGHLDDFAQSLQSAEPTLATINSHDALAFTDGEWLSSSLTGTYQTVIAAVEFTNNTTGNAIFASNGVNFSVQQKYLTSSTASSNWGYQNTGTWEWTNGSTATANSDGTVYALGEISRSAQSGIFANLSTSYSPTANGLNGTVGEVIAFSGTLTATQVKTIETYLVNKWG